jgi:hypothetical protein
MSGFTTTGSTVLADIEAVHRASCSGAASPSGSAGWGSSSSASRSSPTSAWAGCSSSGWRRPAPPPTACVRASARRRSCSGWCTLALTGVLVVLYWLRRDERLRRGEPRADHDADRRLLDAQRVDGRLLAVHPVGDHRLHVPGRDQLHAALPVPPAGPAVLARHRVAALHRDHPGSARLWWLCSPARPGRAAGAAAARRPLPGRGDRHHHRLRHRRLHALGARRTAPPLPPLLPRRDGRLHVRRDEDDPRAAGAEARLARDPQAAAPARGLRTQGVGEAGPGARHAERARLRADLHDALRRRHAGDGLARALPPRGGRRGGDRHQQRGPGSRRARDRWRTSARCPGRGT